jgi:hypothetical protein
LQLWQFWAAADLQGQLVSSGLAGCCHYCSAGAMSATALGVPSTSASTAAASAAAHSMNTGHMGCGHIAYSAPCLLRCALH